MTPGPGVAAVYRDDPRLDALIGPGGQFEVEDVVLDGIALRDFVRAPRTIVEVFEMGATHDSLVHVVLDDQRITFGEIRQQARRIARGLQERFDIRPGDRVAIAMRNLPEFVVSFWATALTGAIVVPLNSWWTGGELDYALRDAGAALVFLDDERLERVRGHGLPDGVRLVGVRCSGGDVTFDELAAGAPITDDTIVRLDRDDPVILLYTSGTTGHPKGAVATNRAATANLWNAAFTAARAALVTGGQPRVPRQPASLAPAPLFHVGGVSVMITSQLVGTKLVLMRRWEVEEGLRLAVAENVTSFGGVPTIARQILEHPGVARLGLDIRTFPLGGAPVPPDLPTRALEVFGDHVQILNGYGMTETTSAVVTNIGVEYASRPDSIGRPNLTADVRVEGSHGEPLGTGQVGELCFRSPQLVRGYWNNEVASTESFVDGWFHSGDAGYLDDEGFVYIVDRLKDVVIRGGENVYCAEVEAVLHEHPDVAGVTVVGLPERTMGERVCAVVVPHRRGAPTLADLRAFVAPRLAPFKWPEALYVVEELPVTATGKVAKHDVRVRAGAASNIERMW